VNGHFASLVELQALPWELCTVHSSAPTRRMSFLHLNGRVSIFSTLLQNFEDASTAFNNTNDAFSLSLPRIVTDRRKIPKSASKRAKNFLFNFQRNNSWSFLFLLSCSLSCMIAISSLMWKMSNCLNLSTLIPILF